MNENYGFEFYNTIDEVPDWAKESVIKAINKDILRGTGNGLRLTLSEVKVLVWMDRCGLFGTTWTI